MILDWNEYPKVKPEKPGYYLCTYDCLGTPCMEVMDYKTSRGLVWEEQWKGRGFYTQYDGDDICMDGDVRAWVEVEPFKYENEAEE